MNLQILLVALGWSFPDLICIQASLDVLDERFDCIFSDFRIRSCDNVKHMHHGLGDMSTSNPMPKLIQKFYK